MRSLIALLAAGLIAMPVVPEAADSAPPRPAPAPAARAAPSGARVSACTVGPRRRRGLRLRRLAVQR